MRESFKPGDSWKHRHASFPTFKTKKQKPRVLKMKAPFTFDELYCSPLREERCYELKDNGTGKPQVEEKYVARNLQEARLTDIQAMDELLRYTSLSLAEVARRSGLGSAHNLYLTTKREFGEAPAEHRKNLREPGDEGRYR